MATFVAPDGHVFDVYEDTRGRFRWRVKAKNGRIVNASEQGYKSKYYASLKARIAANQYRTPR